MRSWIKYVLVSILLAVFSAPAYSQMLSDTLRIYFHKSSTVYDKSYRNNEARAKEFFERLNILKTIPGISFVKIETVGSASPEGPRQLNVALSEGRHEVLHKIIRENTDLPDSIILSRNIPVNWEAFIKVAKADSELPDKQRVLDIAENYQGDKIQQLRSLDEGRVYEYISQKIFPNIRASRIIYGVDISAIIEEPSIEPMDTLDWLADELLLSLPVDTTLNIVIADPIPVKPAKVDPVYKIWLKSNVLGWGLGMMNLAAEFDIIDHLSVHVPFYYSGGYDYFSPFVKFRGIVLQPEVRYYPWLKDGHNRGFFVGGHLGVGYYNYALNGDFRIQDYNGRRPAFGGGLSVGYKVNFKKKPSWGMEFALGAGLYNVKYDILYNEINGPYYNRGIQKNWFGLDNASVSFFYEFDVRRKGGRK